MEDCADLYGTRSDPFFPIFTPKILGDTHKHVPVRKRTGIWQLDTLFDLVQ